MYRDTPLGDACSKFGPAKCPLNTVNSHGHFRFRSDTPERMDGENVLADFGNRITSEIRLPEALEEKLLCPFHYFGVADPVSLNQDRFWKNGRYDPAELENVYIGAHIQARQRLDVILNSLK